MFIFNHKSPVLHNADQAVSPAYKMLEASIWDKLFGCGLTCKNFFHVLYQKNVSANVLPIFHVSVVRSATRREKSPFIFCYQSAVDDDIFSVTSLLFDGNNSPDFFAQGKSIPYAMSLGYNDTGKIPAQSERKFYRDVKVVSKGFGLAY